MCYTYKKIRKSQEKMQFLSQVFLAYKITYVFSNYVICLKFILILSRSYNAKIGLDVSFFPPKELHILMHLLMLKMNFYQ